MICSLQAPSKNAKQQLIARSQGIFKIVKQQGTTRFPGPIGDFRVHSWEVYYSVICIPQAAFRNAKQHLSAGSEGIFKIVKQQGTTRFAGPIGDFRVHSWELHYRVICSLQAAFRNAKQQPTARSQGIFKIVKQQGTTRFAGPIGDFEVHSWEVHYRVIWTLQAAFRNAKQHLTARSQGIVKIVKQQGTTRFAGPIGDFQVQSWKVHYMVICILQAPFKNAKQHPIARCEGIVKIAKQQGTIRDSRAPSETSRSILGRFITG